MSAGTPLVEVRDLCKHFPVGAGATVHAVENVSLQVGRGETLAVVGESGCGKSTLAHTMIRLHEPTSGQVVLDGVDISGLGNRALREHRAKMQIIFQDPFASLDPRRPVGRAVAEPLLIHKIAKGPDADEQVADLFTRVGLEPDMMRQFPHQFSGGQRQRVCIARALATRPELVIADEAVSALDVSIQAQVINLMMELQSELGLSYLFISHDLAVVERMSHRVAVMYLGQIVEIGPGRRSSRTPSTRTPSGSSMPCRSPTRALAVTGRSLPTRSRARCGRRVPHLNGWSCARLLRAISSLPRAD